MSSSKRTAVTPKEWAKYLRSFGKKEFWSSVRNLFRSEEKEEMIQEIDPEELKRNKEEYETELRASLNGEPDNRLPYIVATRIDDGVNEEFGIPVKDRHGNVLHYTNMTMPCPEPNQINPADDKCVSTIKSLIDLHGKTIEELTKPSESIEIFKSIREEMGEPGPMSFDDRDQRMANTNKLCENGVQPLITIEKPQLPIAITHPIHLSKEDQIKANAETIDVFFPDKEDKPLPKVVTIEVSGVVGVGKTFLLQMIDDAIQAKFGVVPLCAELEDEGRQINTNAMPQDMIDDYKSGKIIIEMRERTIKPKTFTDNCPCCD